VIGTFRKNTPFNVFWLLFFALVLKLNIFLQPQAAVAGNTDGFLYHELLRFLQPAGKVWPAIYSVIEFILLFTQAITINKLVNDQKLFSRNNYLPGMCFLLVTSLFPGWNHLNSVAIINSLLVWVWAKLSNLYNNDSPKTTIFNIGLIIGVASFFYFPSIVFGLLLIIGVMIMRPPRLGELLVGFLGLITPYYFLAAYLYLVDHFSVYGLFPSFNFKLPVFKKNFFQYASPSIILLFVLLGIYYVQQNSGRMLIQARKSWGILALYLVVALMLPFINLSSASDYWVLVSVPVAVLASAMFYYQDESLASFILFWAVFIYVMIYAWLPLYHEI
jgi:hypothetical protein